MHGCGCRDCNEVTAETAHMTTAAMVTDVSTNIHVGDRVLVRGAFTGVVRYVGDLDSRFVDSRLYVGVKLDDPCKFTELTLILHVLLLLLLFYY